MTNQPGSSARPEKEPYYGPKSFLHADKVEMRRINWEFWPKASKTDAEAEKAVEKDGLRPERSVAEVERRCSPGCSFEQLMEGKHMLDTIWADPRFSMSLPLFRDSGVDRSRLLEIYLGARADRGLLRWDGKEGGSLSAWMSSRFAENYTRDAATLKTIPGRPWIVRMRLSNTSKLRLYQDLARFKVPRYQVAEDAVEKSPQYVKRGYYYSCVAVVKLRDRDTAADTLRLYSKKCTRLIFDFTFPWSEEWLVEDGGEYMLYFFRSSA
ncbi:hypothetical protein B0T26DRAFT_804687 [Lasiosphaeria miniovina]|uniref:Uncharacterized protein n=1 Tax=Lasiosphaeria miniovina TaxID=1954250 RepID=A0AA40ADY5_9PEZI|nr:uncharacterized protein B0T26DRAFT_804687 [Lasiosphaeria miniovina]KAK0714086.1 hypothetical protein B0T26DRAFT_804687 [Lasiosphaeria miniovina]